MRIAAVFLVLLLAGCGVSETAELEVRTCPECPRAYDGFSTCAFFEADDPGAHTLIDAGNYQGRGIPVFHDGYMHHKFCFNDSHAAFGSANPTSTGLSRNDNLVLRVESPTFAKNFRAEYDFLRGRGDGGHTTQWMLNGRPVEHFFCPRDECEKQLLDLVSHARERVIFLSFSFTSDALAEALVDLHEAGVCVSGVMESLGAHGSGSEYDALTSAGVGVALADTPGLMHHKAWIVDSSAVVGSYNPSLSADRYNAETLVFIREPAVVQAIRREFVRVGGAGCVQQTF